MFNLAPAAPLTRSASVVIVSLLWLQEGSWVKLIIFLLSSLGDWHVGVARSSTQVSWKIERKEGNFLLEISSTNWKKSIFHVYEKKRRRERRLTQHCQLFNERTFGLSLQKSKENKIYRKQDEIGFSRNIHIIVLVRRASKIMIEISFSTSSIAHTIHTIRNCLRDFSSSPWGWRFKSNCYVANVQNDVMITTEKEDRDCRLEHFSRNGRRQWNCWALSSHTEQPTRRTSLTC